MKIKDSRFRPVSEVEFGDVLVYEGNYLLVVKDNLYEEVRLVDLETGTILSTYTGLHKVKEIYADNSDVIKADKLKLVI